MNTTHPITYLDVQYRLVGGVWRNAAIRQFELADLRNSINNGWCTLDDAARSLHVILSRYSRRPVAAVRVTGYVNDADRSVGLYDVSKP